MRLMAVTASANRVQPRNRIVLPNSIPNRKVIFHATSESYTTYWTSKWIRSSFLNVQNRVICVFFREIIFDVPHNIAAKCTPNTKIIVLESQTITSTICWMIGLRIVSGFIFCKASIMTPYGCTLCWIE